MKRDASGKFVNNWDLETKQRISVSLTSTAWRSLNETAQKHNMSRSEVIERLARGLESEPSIQQWFEVSANASLSGATVPCRDLTEPELEETETQAESSLNGFGNVLDLKPIADGNPTEALLRRSANRAKQLQRVTAALAEASTPKQVAKAVVERGISALGAQAGGVYLVHEENNSSTEGDASPYLTLSEVIGYPQPLLDLWGQLPTSTPIVLVESVRTQKPIFLSHQSEILKHFPQMADVLAITQSQAIATIPLIVSGRTLGGIGISFANPQPFDEDDRTFILTLAQQCAQAIARAQLYEAEQQARALAEAANRAKDEFLAVLSHELRTPLNPILGWTQLLLRGKLDDNTTAIALKTIERNAKLQVQLIEDLLDISRILQGKLILNAYPVNLVSTIEAAIETVRLMVDTKAIQLQTHFPTTSCMVLGDPTRLQQVVWNLLSNAVKFTPSEGTIDIHLERTGDYVSIQIRDSGKGIQSGFLPHVFDYFRQADSSITRTFGGLGLGLAIARHIVELHGGVIQAESGGEGQGATFTVTFPSWKEPLQAPSVNRCSASSHVDLQGVRVLVVDDEIDNLDLLTFILEQAGATVTAVASALEGLEQFRQNVPDILLADIGMPEIDGYNLLHQIRQFPPEQGGQVPAIALTAYASKADQLEVLAAGFQRHIAKPVALDDLLTEIKQLVNQT
ncbi:MAG: ATP-binding protein [Oculatellaceae cyanobacterium bins.114]|nr:ATP-binding protein [Oculatellaceae cyanobacterium bins.114]